MIDVFINWMNSIYNFFDIHKFFVYMIVVFTCITATANMDDYIIRLFNL